MRRRSRDDRGATAVEFALVVPLALLLIGSIVTFALHMTYSALADHAARVALKKAVIRTSAGYPTEAQVRQTAADLFAAGLLGSPTDLDMTRGGGTAPVGQGDTVTIRVTYDLPAVRSAAGLVPFAGLRDRLVDLATVSRTAEGRAE